MQIEAIEATADARATFSADAKALADAAAFLARRMIERRNSIPILSHILIFADPAGHITMTGTDLDQVATITLPATVDQPGAVCVEAGPLSDALAKLAKAKARECSFAALDGHRAEVKTEGVRACFKLRTLPADDFPLAVTPTDGEPLARFTVEAGQFRSDLAALAPCVSTEETRYYLNGIALQVRDLGGRERFTMGATDGWALAMASRPIPAGAEGLGDVILPRKAVSTIERAAKLASDADAIQVEAWERGGRFTFGPVVIETKWIDGTFPDLSRPFADNLAPIMDEAAPLFPELVPGAPLAAMAKLEKGVGQPIEWETAAHGRIGTIPADPGLVFGCIAVTAHNEPVKGYRYSYEHDRARAAEYLRDLAAKRNGPIPAEWGTVLQTVGTDAVGMTIGTAEWVPGRYVERPNWETLVVERVYVEPSQAWDEGSYSIVMPRESAALRTDVTLEIEGDCTVYPIAQNNAGAIHLTGDQVARMAGPADTRVIQVRTRGGRTAHVYAATWEAGAFAMEPCKANGGEIRKGFAIHTQIMRADVVWTSADGDLPVEALEPVENCAPEAVESESAPIAACMEPEALDALHGPEIGSGELVSETCELPALDPVAALAERVSALEARLATLPAESAQQSSEADGEACAISDTPIAAAQDRPRRTVAHERAIRRAWAERSARRIAMSESARLSDICRDRDAEMQEWRRTDSDRLSIIDRLVSKRLAAAQRARRMIAAARAKAEGQRQHAAVVAADLAKLRADMVDPLQPERASDIARLVRERDEAKHAAAAVSQRNATLQRALDDLGDRFEAIASRVAVAEAAARRANAA